MLQVCSRTIGQLIYFYGTIISGIIIINIKTI